MPNVYQVTPAVRQLLKSIRKREERLFALHTVLQADRATVVALYCQASGIDGSVSLSDDDTNLILREDQHAADVRIDSEHDTEQEANVAV